jgi:uncharacterized alkaline shock family protein YloU
VNRVLPMTPAPAPAGPAAEAIATTGTSAPATRTPAAPAERGRLEVSERAAARIATAALTEVDDIGGPVRRRPTPPRVAATVRGATAGFDVRCTVAYPAPVGRTVERARAHLVSRVGELTGLTVAHVDVEVTALTTPEPGGLL